MSKNRNMVMKCINIGRLMIILASLESWECQLSNDAKLVKIRPILMRIWAFFHTAYTQKKCRSIKIHTSILAISTRAGKMFRVIYKDDSLIPSIVLLYKIRLSFSQIYYIVGFHKYLLKIVSRLCVERSWSTHQKTQDVFCHTKHNREPKYN